MDQGDLVGNRVCVGPDRARRTPGGPAVLRCTKAGMGAGRGSEVPMSRNVEE